ncbi:UNVERIFIED_ORG: sugar/nucleoside kinase (ribokinase family) [Arthrobacter sp. UYEF2]
MTSIDTVGAGDAFTAGYLSALLDGEDVACRPRPQALTVGVWEMCART